MTNIVLTDKHFQFCQSIAAGEHAYLAYKQHISEKKNIADSTARVNASKLLRFPEIQAELTRARAERQKAVANANNELIKTKALEAAEQLPPEFFGLALTVDNLDQLHYSIIKGMVEVEEVVPIKKTTRNKSGKVIEETVNFMRVKRKPNIRERQASIDALYKRFGSYAPVKGMFGLKSLGSDDEGDKEVQRFVLLSDGSKIPFE